MLEIKDAQVVYPNGFEALKSVSLTVQPGEIVALVGRSGAGKSTLLRTINGLQQLSAGTIRINDVELSGLDQEQLANFRRNIGFIWQEYNVVERISAFRNVLTGRLGHNRNLASLFYYFSKEDRAIAMRSLERVNLLHRANLRSDRLSGGEKQRVAIARALAQQPCIILADEPVASLDIELSWQVMNDLVRVARDEGVPTVISIHAIDLAREFADRVVGIANGTVVCDCPANEFGEDKVDVVYRFDKPRTPQPTVAPERELVGAGV